MTLSPFGNSQPELLCNIGLSQERWALQSYLKYRPIVQMNINYNSSFFPNLINTYRVRHSFLTYVVNCYDAFWFLSMQIRCFGETHFVSANASQLRKVSREPEALGTHFSTLSISARHWFHNCCCVRIFDLSKRLHPALVFSIYRFSGGAVHENDISFFTQLLL